MWTRVNRPTCNLYSVVECASLQGLSSDLREGSGCTMNTQHQSTSSPPPRTHTENMDAELFLGEEEEEEVEESPPPYQVSRLLQGPSTKQTRSEHTQMGCRPLVVPSLPRVLGAYATYMGLLYSIPVCVNLDYRVWVKGGVACMLPTVRVCSVTFAWLLFKSGVY